MGTPTSCSLISLAWQRNLRSPDSQKVIPYRDSIESPLQASQVEQGGGGGKSAMRRHEILVGSVAVRWGTNWDNTTAVISPEQNFGGQNQKDSRFRSSHCMMSFQAIQPALLGFSQYLHMPTMLCRRFLGAHVELLPWKSWERGGTNRAMTRWSRRSS